MSHISDGLLRDWTQLIESGERGSNVDGFATAAIRDFWLRQSLGSPHSPVMLSWVAEVLRRATEHRNPSQLLDELGLLPKPKRRPPDPQKAIDVGWWLRCAVNRGYSETEAVELAAERFHKDTKSIERYRRDADSWASGMRADDETWEIYFSTRKPPRPLPEPKSKSKSKK